MGRTSKTPCENSCEKNICQVFLRTKCSSYAHPESLDLAITGKIVFSSKLRFMKRIVGLTRYAVFVPAIASMIGALLLMMQGSIEMVVAVIDTVLNGYGLKQTIVAVLTAVDAILLGTVLLVIGYGLYELFIDADLDVPTWLRVDDLDDLKSKLIGVVVAIIAVVFVGVFVDSNRADDVLSYGVGAGALVVGLAIFAYATQKEDLPSKANKNK